MPYALGFVKRLASAAGLGAFVLLWGEYENWRSSHRLVGSATGPSEAVVVLGWRNPGTGANAVNRWRVRAGLRSQDESATTRRLVLCGGGPPGARTEAEVMAEYARGSCGYRGELVLEDRSRTTWENIENAIPLIEDVSRIKIVSNPLHAEKGRLYLTRRRPDLADHLVRGADYRFGEWLPLKPLAAIYGRWVLRKARKG
jgi:hypothetical protein